MSEMEESYKFPPEIAADHAKKTPAYDKTRNATSDDENGLKEMPEACDKAEKCAQPGDSTPGVYVPKHCSFSMGLGCY